MGRWGCGGDGAWLWWGFGYSDVVNNDMMVL